MLIDIRCFDDADSPGTVRHNPFIRFFALLFRQLLAISDALIVPEAFDEETGSRHHWSRKCTAACFVDPDDDGLGNQGLVL